MKAKLTPEGLVLYLSKIHTTIRFNEEETKQVVKGLKQLPKDYPGPEIVHLEIANRCNLKCKYCYVGEKKGEELTTEQWKQIIKKLDTSGVFQITFGGGEPTLRDDLIELASYTKELGLNLTMTSNGILIPYFKKKELRLFDQINISYHKANASPLKVLRRALKHLQRRKVRRGINYCLSAQYLADVDKVVEVAKECDAEILFLVYKPVVDDWANQVPPEGVMRVAKAQANAGVRISVDGASCNTCVGAKRFMDIDHKGDVYPCSFIRESIGNLLYERLEDIWGRRKKELECPYLK